MLRPLRALRVLPRPLLLVLPLALAWPGCSGGAGGTAAAYPRKIVAQPEGGGPARPILSQAETESESYLQLPKIALAYDEKLVQVLTTNLDADAENEQVIIVKNSDGPDAALKLIIADFGDAQTGHVRSWETGIGALEERTVRIAVEDVIGNHTFQIFTSGMTKSNRAALSAWKIASQAAGRLAYTRIFGLESDVSVEIEESDRGLGYSHGYSSGASFPIVVISRDPATADVSSIVRDTYAYSAASQSYVLQRHETIKVEKAATERLAGLLQNSSPELLKKYIAGIWYKADEAGKSDEKILAVNAEAGEIAFYSKDVQEVYNLKYSRRSLYNTLHMYTESALLKSVQPNITAVLDSPTELTIAITEYSTMEQWLNEQWGGTYVKLKQPQAAAGDRAVRDQAGPAASFLRGEYLSQTGARVTFASPAFTWREGTVSEAGGFLVTSVDGGGPTRFLLSLKIIEDQGLTITDKFFILDLPAPPPDGEAAASFTLKPAQTTVYGVVNLKGQPLSFTRQGR